jgi:uncharacterized protein YjbI with pentapeptide repeats
VNFAGADLKGADLTRAEFKGANLEKARLGKNAGVSEQIKQNFIQRGAFFE